MIPKLISLVLTLAADAPAPSFVIDVGAIAGFFTSSALGAAVASGVFLLWKARIDRRARQDVTPVDENDRIKLGNDFLTGLLREAREERKELRETISALERDGTTKAERIQALQNLDARKTQQIELLELRAEGAAQKLRAGIPLTVEDILGPNHRFLDELDSELEDTITSN